MQPTNRPDLAGRVAMVTGAGAGLGRAEAEALAGAGARLVLNDLPGAVHEVAEGIRAAGGEARVVAGDIGERSTADELVAEAERLGGPDILVNNAGVLRDRMLFNMSDDDWDTVLRVHLRGHFLTSRNVAAYWRAEAKRTGEPVRGAVVNTASEAFALGPPGQPNYAAAKAGIVALTVSTARVLGRIGGRANAICPRARTGMTERVFAQVERSEDGTDPLSPRHVATLVSYLCSPAAEPINGQVFVVYGGMVALLAPPTVHRRFDAGAGGWDLAGLDDAVGGYFAGGAAPASFAADDILELG